jgi:hypothetical protein
MGIEPTYLAWEANVLPLNYTRLGANSIKRYQTPFRITIPTLGATLGSSRR